MFNYFFLIALTRENTMVVKSNLKDQNKNKKNQTNFISIYKKKKRANELRTKFLTGLTKFFIFFNLNKFKLCADLSDEFKFYNHSRQFIFNL
jgi:hypothetical protein